jgi:hypothetical protein
MGRKTAREKSTHNPWLTLSEGEFCEEDKNCMQDARSLLTINYSKIILVLRKVDCKAGQVPVSLFILMLKHFGLYIKMISSAIFLD